MKQMSSSSSETIALVLNDQSLLLLKPSPVFLEGARPRPQPEQAATVPALLVLFPTPFLFVLFLKRRTHGML